MKKKILLLSLMIACVACLFAVSVSAEDKIIKLDKLPTLEEIHQNRDAYVSHLDAFDGDSLGEKDSQSVVVLSDLAETPTYYVFPSYYYMRTTNNTVWGYLTKLNEAIAAADSTAFANYVGIGGGWSAGGCLHLIRYEVPTYVTSITGTSKFEGDKNLKEVYFPVHTVIDEETGLEKTVAYVTSVSGQNLFSNCSSLEYVWNSEYLSAGVVAGNQDGFANCSSLKEFKIPNTATSIGLRCFINCSSLKEIILPNSVVSVSKGAFSGCTSLETFSFGAGFTTFIRVNVDYETFSGSNNLKYVYMPATFADSIMANKGDFKTIFPTMKNKVTFFLTGDKAKAEEILNKFVTTEANPGIANATLVEYDPTIDYKTYAETLGYSILVYNYDYCLAYYGEHAMQGTAIPDVTSYLDEIAVCDRCTRQGCGKTVVVETISALFKNKGYSIKTFGDKKGITQNYEIDKDAIIAYKAYVPEFDFGVLAVANTKGTAISPDPQDESVVDISFNSMANDYIEVMLVGIPSDKLDVNLVCCVYITDKEGISYIDNGVASSTVTGVTYNSFANK